MRHLRARAWRRVVPLALLLACAAALAAQEPVPLLDAAPRPGWSVRASRGLAAKVANGILQVRPSGTTGLFAAVMLAADPAASVDARGLGYLAMEINTLADTGGRHRVPPLRVGLSDPSGRSRQPLLSRYVQVDTDASTWQQVLIPIPDLLDRGVRAQEIAVVSWQYTGPTSPFAVRRVSLIPRAEPASGAAGSLPNLLADPSFEARADARPVWSLVGDYRDAGRPDERAIQQGNAPDGRRFLRLRGTRAYFFEALAPRSGAVGFGVALRSESQGRRGDGEREGSPATERATNAPRAPDVEIGCEVVGFGSQGGVVAAARAARRVTPESGWRRHAASAVVAPGTMPPAEADLCLYRGWVRPLGAGSGVDVDAVQLSPTVVTETAFDGRRANLLAEGAGAYRPVRGVLDYRPLAPEHDSPTPPVFQVDLPPVHAPLEAREWAGRDWPRAMVAGGIPLARGSVYSPDALRLRGPDGADIPFQCDVLRRDTRDGSVRVLWVAFERALAARERLPLTLESGAVAAPRGPDLAREAGEEILVNTGALRLRIPRDRFPLFAEAQWGEDVLASSGGGIRLEMQDGRTLRSSGAPARIAVERNGPLAAVVAVRGFLSPERQGAAPSFFYHARLRFWKGVPGLQVDLAVTNLTPEPATPIRSLALDVPAWRARRADAALGRERAAPLIATLNGEQILRVTQRRDPFRAGDEDLYVEAPGAEPAAQSGRAAGWARWESEGHPALSLGFNHMADRHPSAIEVGTHGLSAYLVPTAGVLAFDFPFGLTAYGEFWIGAGESPEAGMDRMRHPPLLAAAPAQAAATRAFGTFALPDETAHHAPLLDGILRAEMALAAGHTERTGETGWLNDGDAGTFGWWRRGDTDDAESFYLQYLRTGEPLAWEHARRRALHLREGSTWWSNQMSAFQFAGAGGLPICYTPEPGRFRLTGLLFDYWLTGDRRSLDVAEALGAQLLSRVGFAHYHGPERGRLLLHLAELYAATGRRVFRDGYERHLAAGSFKDASGYAAGLAVCALTEGIDALGRGDLAPNLSAAFSSLAAGVLAQRPPARLGHPPETILFRGLSLAPPEALPRPAWAAAWERVLWMGLTPYGRDPSLVRASQALAAMAPLGLPTPEWAKGIPLGIAPFTGGERRFTVRIHHAQDEPAAVTLCHSFADPPDHTQRYRVRAELRDPLGRAIAREMVEGEKIEARTITLPRWGPPGAYTLTLSCDDDGFVEVVSAHPRVYLRADEWRASRYAQGQARFFLRGPRAGEVRVAARGSAVPNGDGLIAAALRTPEGQVVARARWSVPLAGTDAEGRPGSRTFPAVPLRLPVPLAQRGRPLVLELTTPRAVEWRVEGLDDPWLAASPEAIQ